MSRVSNFEQADIDLSEYRWFRENRHARDQRIGRCRVRCDRYDLFIDEGRVLTGRFHRKRTNCFGGREFVRGF